MSNVSLIDGHIDEPRMTDNEIIKALECCIKSNCNECPFYKNWNVSQCGELRKLALDLINRKDAEIERLEDSIKEANEYFSEGDFANGIAIIINLVKEMIGDTDEE